MIRHEDEQQTTPFRASQTGGDIAAWGVNRESQARFSGMDERPCDTESISEWKEYFLSKISHELRTPLSIVIMWSKMINRELLTPAQMKEGMEAIERSADAQKKIIDDLLQSARREQHGNGHSMR